MSQRAADGRLNRFGEGIVAVAGRVAWRWWCSGSWRGGRFGWRGRAGAVRQTWATRTGRKAGRTRLSREGRSEREEGERMSSRLLRATTGAAGPASRAADFFSQDGGIMGADRTTVSGGSAYRWTAKGEGVCAGRAGRRRAERGGAGGAARGDTVAERTAHPGTRGRSRAAERTAHLGTRGWSRAAERTAHPGTMGPRPWRRTRGGSTGREAGAQARRKDVLASARAVS